MLTMRFAWKAPVTTVARSCASPPGRALILLPCRAGTRPSSAHALVPRRGVSIVGQRARVGELGAYVQPGSGPNPPDAVMKVVELPIAAQGGRSHHAPRRVVTSHRDTGARSGDGRTRGRRAEVVETSMKLRRPCHSAGTATAMRRRRAFRFALIAAQARRRRDREERARESRVPRRCPTWSCTSAKPPPIRNFRARAPTASAPRRWRHRPSTFGQRVSGSLVARVDSSRRPNSPRPPGPAGPADLRSGFATETAHVPSQTGEKANKASTIPTLRNQRRMGPVSLRKRDVEEIRRRAESSSAKRPRRGIDQFRLKSSCRSGCVEHEAELVGAADR